MIRFKTIYIIICLISSFKLKKIKNRRKSSKPCYLVVWDTEHRRSKSRKNGEIELRSLFLHYVVFRYYSRALSRSAQDSTWISVIHNTHISLRTFLWKPHFQPLSCCCYSAYEPGSGPGTCLTYYCHIS